MFQSSYQLDETHVLLANQAEYEALIIGLELARSMRIPYLKVFGDSQLVIRQVIGQYRCNSAVLGEYLEQVLQLVKGFETVEFEHMLRLENKEANKMAHSTSSLRIPNGFQERIVRIQKRTMPCVRCQQLQGLSILTLEVLEDNWRSPLIKYLSDPEAKVNRRIKYQAMNYVIMGDDLFRRNQDRLSLLCIRGLE
ncbi:uncharacterized protein LOC114323718 [Camellia sinensis]|uniref:uncharacterized protein LOC114323718 n=1 Tax=Camellia sinensis TaxID=4442 RepID=UPI001036C247|nr:uncharacterized protein LOC114323718 [Camellia sinensis]